MSLPLLVIIVGAGIALVVAAVHLTGGSRLAALEDEAAARRRFAQDFPDIEVKAVHITHARDTAFLDLAEGRVGIVRAVGGKFLTRLVMATDLASVPRASNTTVAIRFRDFTWPGGIFAFRTAEEARAVATMFAALRKSALWEKNG